MSIAWPMLPIVGLEIKRRANLVVADGGARVFDQASAGSEMFVHPSRRLATARTGEPDCANVAELLLLRLSRLLREKNRRHAPRRQRLHDVGGSCKVVAIKGKQQLGHQTAFAYFSPSLSIASTFRADGPLWSKSEASQVSTMALASSGPITLAPIVMICALFDLAARSAE